MVEHGGVVYERRHSCREWLVHFILVADILTNVVVETRPQKCTKVCLMWVPHSLFGT